MNRVQRAAIVLIVVVFVVGSVGVYLIALFAGNNETVTSSQTTDTNKQKEKTVDPTAYTTKDPVKELQITDLTPGTGAEAKAGSTVKVKYKGSIAQTGQVFDQSQEPIELSLSQVIAGWSEGIPGMKVGGKRRLVIPADKGYGASGTPDGSIPPNTDLVFEVELTEVK